MRGGTGIWPGGFCCTRRRTWGVSFGMSARSRPTRREIHGVLKTLRSLDKKKRTEGEVVAASVGILAKDEDFAFERETPQLPTPFEGCGVLAGRGGELRAMVGAKVFRQSLAGYKPGEG